MILFNPLEIVESDALQIIARNKPMNPGKSAKMELLKQVPLYYSNKFTKYFCSEINDDLVDLRDSASINQIYTVEISDHHQSNVSEKNV